MTIKNSFKFAKKHKYLICVIASIIIILIDIFLSLFQYSSSINFAVWNGLDAFVAVAIIGGSFQSIGITIGVAIMIIPDVYATNIINISSLRNVKVAYVETIKKSLIGGVVIVLALCVALIICQLMCHGNEKIFSIAEGIGLFQEVRNINLPLYIAFFFFHSFIFGFLMNFLSRSIYCITRSIKQAVFFCVLLYYINKFIPDLSGTPIQFISGILYFAPFFVYQIFEYEISLGQRILDFAIIFILATILFYFAYKKKKGIFFDEKNIQDA